ncbi:MAG: hypothetical protein AABX97_00010, partial [Candidatus Thermoplasmatota archaeon]
MSVLISSFASIRSMLSDLRSAHIFSNDVGMASLTPIFGLIAAQRKALLSRTGRTSRTLSLSRGFPLSPT